MATINVKASPGIKMPREGSPNSYIPEDIAVPVESSHYYRKAIADGDLIEVSDKALAKQIEKTETPGPVGGSKKSPQ